jgi:glycosyltransferase involved in cell wall biosynthesis
LVAWLSFVKIVFLTTDNRENYREYDKAEPYFGTAPEALLQGLAQIDGVEVHAISCIQKPMSAPAKLAANIFFHELVVPKIGWLRTAYQGCVRAVRAKVKSIRPNVVHGQGTERDCALSAVYSGFPSVITVHGNMRLIARLNRARPFSYQWIAARLERFTLPRSDGVVCITNYTRDAVKQLARRTWIIPNAVDATFFSGHYAPEQPQTLLYIGQVNYRKNQIGLIEALDPLAARHPFRLLFLGGGSSADPYFVRFLEMLKTRPWCQYGGVAGRSQLKKHLERATALILVSLEDNCPMVVLEAMAVGVPVIAPNVGGVPDLVQHRVNGLLCEPTEQRSIQNEVASLLNNGEFRVQLGQRGKEHARERFHPRVVASQHMAAYKEISRLVT